MDSAEKVRDNRVRRILARQGYVLSRSRRRDPRAADYGRYTITDGGGKVVIVLSLDDAERWAQDGAPVPISDLAGEPAPQELLSETEIRALDLTAELAGVVIGEIIGIGPTRSTDVAEATMRIHAIQQMIMSQGAARAYPGKFRLLGE